jgi:signal transduction histidine kinase
MARLLHPMYNTKRLSDSYVREKPEVPVFHSFVRNLRSHFLPLAFLLVPGLGMLLLSAYGPTLQPVINVLFLLAVAAAAWWGGIIAGVLSALVAVSVFGSLASHSATIFPEHFRVTAAFILLAAAILVSQVASARKKNEEILLASNLLLEQRVKERTEELDKALQRVQESNEELQHFASAVSHDLQEPLRGLTTSTQLLQRRLGAELSGEAETLVHEILLGASRLNQLVRDLLSYTQILGDTRNEISSTALGDAVIAVTFNLREQIQSANARITCVNSPLLAVKRFHLEQILQNLISNALKYRSDTEPVIEIEAHRQGNDWHVRIADNGIGIRSDHHERVFEPFSRLNTRSEASGTGLGLSLCRRIIGRSGGRIWVESEVGKGSSFYFTLPAVDREQ